MRRDVNMLPAKNSLTFPVRLGNYMVENVVLGKGNFAVVRMGTHIPTGEKVAVKIIEKKKISHENLQKVYREIGVMKRLRHPNVIRLYHTLETVDYVFLVTEYAENGEVFDYIVSKGRLKEDVARKFFRQLLAAICHCHTHSVVHRDLKAENLLLDFQMNIKLADFGFSNILTHGSTMTEWCGSPPYAAPELFQGVVYDGVKCDIWSLGIVLYVLICGALPFDGDNLNEIKARVLNGRFRVPFFMSRDCENLLRLMLVIDPHKRCNLQTVMNHRWVRAGNCDVIQDCSDEDYGFEDGELNEFVLDDMEKLGYHRNLVRHMVMSDPFHDISATYHILNDAFSRKLKTGDRVLITPIPISCDNTSRRSSITTGIVERDALTPSTSRSSITGGMHSSPQSTINVDRKSPATSLPRRGSLPQHIRFFQPSAFSGESEECLLEAAETEEAARIESMQKSPMHLQVPMNPLLSPFARRASEGTPCLPLTGHIQPTQPSGSTDSTASSALPYHLQRLSIASSSEMEPDQDAVRRYLASRGVSKRHTVSNTGGKRPSSHFAALPEHRRFSPVRRHSEPHSIVTPQQRSFLEKLYLRAVSPMEEMNHLQRQLDSGHASPFCHSPVSPAMSHPWHSQQHLCHSPSSPSNWHTQLSPDAPKFTRFPTLVVTNEYGVTRPSGFADDAMPMTFLRPPAPPKASLRHPAGSDAPLHSLMLPTTTLTLPVTKRPDRFGGDK
ncbi:serine/threonine-protein kinase SIK3-like [Paramacrobiotus metropolitanus]|uniref:serine/threonine-protein kinase SIK3-like n=1 Tax=Paramacrobiotus metropolitanus TaxID=2943436 RepID=UPI002445F9C2|nr:serine/threonine-protein kinase SIK3-like [Paramacrobiotus metropolitanus]